MAGTDVPLTDWSASAEESLSLEIAHSEIARARAMVVALLGLTVGAGALMLFTGEGDGGFRQRVPYALVFLLAWAAYEAAAWRVLERWQREGRSSGWLFRYANTLIELSATSVLILMPTLFEGIGLEKGQLLHSAAPYLWFIPIVLSAMYLDFRICLFAGLVAAVQVVGLFAMHADSFVVPSNWEILVSPGSAGARAILLMLAGVAAGFVAVRSREKVEAAIRSVAQRDRAVSMFGQHVSPEVAELLLSQPADVGGEEREVCVMFLDIRDFSAIAAERTPQEVVDYLNVLFGELIHVVNARNGIVNKFLGDGFMAVFGAPIDSVRAPTHAVEAAFDMLEVLERLNAEGAIPHTRVGIGLHLGEVVTGNVGSSERKEYTIIGDAVNLASRIEQATKQFGASVLISSAVYGTIDAERFPAEDLGDVELKGQKNPAHLYRLS